MIFNDLGFDGRFKSLPSRTVAILKIALPLRKYPHFRCSTDHFHQLFGCPLGGGYPGSAAGIGPPNRPKIGFTWDANRISSGATSKEEDARQLHHKHRSMRTRDVHVYCDNAVADVATKLHHYSIPLRTGIGANTHWSNHIIQGSVGVREAS